MTALSDARAALAELKAKEAGLVATIREAEADRAPIAAKVNANNIRRSKRLIVASLAGEVSVHTMAQVNPSMDYYRGDAKPKAILDALTSGGIKISIGGGYGASYTAKGLTGRVRIPDAATLRAWRLATAARHRADQRAQVARDAEKAAARAAFEAGTKITLNELLPDLGLTAKLRLALAAVPMAHMAKNELDRLRDENWGPLAKAQQHLDHIRKRDVDTGCTICQRAEAERKAAAELRERVTVLPRRKMTCPTHGKKLGYHEYNKGREYVQLAAGSRWFDPATLPVLWCPVDFHRFIDGKQLAADEAKAARKTARAPKSITFICPNPECEETSTSEVDDGSVTCDACGVQLSADVVKIVKAAA